jgi:hypothetical protein
LAKTVSTRHGISPERGLIVLIECKEIDGELYIPLETAGKIVDQFWPFPKAPLPNDRSEPKFNLDNVEDAPL